MKKYALNDITLMQFIFMINGAQLGIGILSLPAQLAKTAGTDGWISLLIGWAIAVLSSVLIILTMKKHPDDTLYDLLTRYFGKWGGGLLRICLTGYFAFAFFTSFVASVAILRLEVLTRTPFPLVVLLFLIPTYTLARNQLRVLSRYAEATFWGFIWLTIIYMKPFQDANWLHLLPVLKEGWSPVLQAVRTTGLSFLGFETAFILYPFLKHKKYAITGVIIGNTITLTIYSIVIMVCFLFFSPDDITSYKFPSIKVIKSIQFRFLDRVDIILLVSYLFMLSRVWIFYLFYALFGASQMLGKQDHQLLLAVALGLTLVSSFFFVPSGAWMDALMKLLGTIGMYVAYVFPILLLLYTRLISRAAPEAPDEAQG